MTSILYKRVEVADGYPAKIIRWQDSISYQDSGVVWRLVGWMKGMAKSMATAEHVSVGIVLEETDDYILFSHSMRDDQAVTVSMSIPKRQIISIEPIYITISAEE